MTLNGFLYRTKTVDLALGAIPARSSSPLVLLPFFFFFFLFFLGGKLLYVVEVVPSYLTTTNTDTIHCHLLETMARKRAPSPPSPSTLPDAGERDRTKKRATDDDNVTESQ